MFQYKSNLVFIFIIFFVSINGISYGQNNSTIPNERIYIHSNTSLLFPGDYLYYKCYVQRLDTKSLSDLSKVVYIELINEDEEIIFNHKVFIKNGLGYGDFFTDQSLPSGNYKIIAYTNWMKNQGVKSFFQDDISIINPFTNDQKNILKSKVEKGAVSAKKQSIAATVKNNSNLLKLWVNKNSFTKRNKVLLSMEAFNSDIKNGSYSISIKQKLPISASKQMMATEFDKDFNFISSFGNLSTTSALPELRGEILMGRVIDSENSNFVKNVGVALSSTSQETLYSTAKTNDSGNFYFNISQQYNEGSLILKTLENNNYTTEIISKEKNDYSSVVFHKLKIDSTLRTKILNKSIHNQIENAFTSVKPDSILVTTPKLFFDSSHLITYNLDDFTRFQTLKQTIQEIIPEVGIKKIKNQESYFVRTPKNILFDNLPSILLLDGLLIDDHSKLNQLDARDIEKIQVFTSNFINNNINYKGALLIQTKDQVLANSLQAYGEHTGYMLSAPQKRKKYFSPNYSTESMKNNSVPDFRYQLLWYPDVQFSNSTNEIEFFTSDIEGTFEISLEGFTQNGIPVSLNQEFSVH